MESPEITRITGIPKAGGFVQEVSVLAPSASVSDAMRSLTESKSPLQYVVVCDQDRLHGCIAASALLHSDPQTALQSLVQRPQAVVKASSGSEHAAFLAAHEGVEVVAVVDDDDRFLGLIPASRLLALMVLEHEVDLARLGGFLSGTRRARTAGEEAIIRRVWHRLPWLFVGLLGAVVAAQIVSSFEGRLEDTVALAFFLPGIVYMADAVGTQTETLVIRGFSVGVSQARMLRLEAITGAIIGALLSLAIFPLALLVTEETTVASIVSIALFASTSIATVVAVSLPSLMQQLDLDPAFGSGPLATVIQDILSISIYFGVAVAVLN
jgi:magnesium transporter